MFKNHLKQAEQTAKLVESMAVTAEALLNGGWNLALAAEDRIAEIERIYADLAEAGETGDELEAVADILGPCEVACHRINAAFGSLGREGSPMRKDLEAAVARFHARSAEVSE